MEHSIKNIVFRCWERGWYVEQVVELLKQEQGVMVSPNEIETLFDQFAFNA